jgi:hypothetical protein
MTKSSKSPLESLLVKTTTTPSPAERKRAPSKQKVDVVVVDECIVLQNGSTTYAHVNMYAAVRNPDIAPCREATPTPYHHAIRLIPQDAFLQGGASTTQLISHVSQFS